MELIQKVIRFCNKKSPADDKSSSANHIVYLTTSRYGTVSIYRTYTLFVFRSVKASVGVKKGAVKQRVIILK